MAEGVLPQGVDAVLGGQEIHFQLRRDHHATTSLEAAIGSPAAAWHRFKNESWLVSDVIAILAHAAPNVVPMHKLTRSPIVDAAMAAHPPAIYAALAVRVLEAFLFGLDADRATFDEANPF